MKMMPAKYTKQSKGVSIFDCFAYFVDKKITGDYNETQFE